MEEEEEVEVQDLKLLIGSRVNEPTLVSMAGTNKSCRPIIHVSNKGFENTVPYVSYDYFLKVLTIALFGSQHSSPHLRSSHASKSPTIIFGFV